MPLQAALRNKLLPEGSPGRRSPGGLDPCHPPVSDPRRVPQQRLKQTLGAGLGLSSRAAQLFPLLPKAAGWRKPRSLHVDLEASPVVCFLSQWEVLGIRDVCLGSFVSLGAKALTCPDAEAHPSSLGPRRGGLSPCGGAAGGPWLQGGHVRMRPGGRKEGSREGGLWGAGRSAQQVFCHPRCV